MPYRVLTVHDYINKVLDDYHKLRAHLLREGNADGERKVQEQEVLFIKAAYGEDADPNVRYISVQSSKKPAKIKFGEAYPDAWASYKQARNRWINNQMWDYYAPHFARYLPPEAQEQWIAVHGPIVDEPQAGQSPDAIFKPFPMSEYAELWDEKASDEYYANLTKK